MRSTLLVLAVWAAYVTSVHVFAGERRVVAPLRKAEVEPFSRGTLLVVWHMATWSLVTLTGAVVLAAFSPRFGDLALLCGLQAAGFATVFAVTSRRELGAAVRLPQWLLLGPLALGLLATLADRPAAIAAGAMVGIIGIGHLAWAFGGTWPASDRAQLAQHVLPRLGPKRLAVRLPSRTMTLAVTAVLFAMSLCLVLPLGAGPRHALVLTIACVFALRGMGGLMYWSRRRECGDDGAPSPFFLYNRIMYSPGCLLIAALAATSVASVP